MNKNFVTPLLAMAMALGLSLAAAASAADQPAPKRHKASAAKTPAVDTVAFPHPATPSPTPASQPGPGRTSLELAGGFADSIRSPGLPGRSTRGWQSQLRLGYAVQGGLDLGVAVNGLGLMNGADGVTVAGLGLNLRWMPFGNQTGLRPYVELNGGWVLSHSASGAVYNPGDSYQGGGAVGILWPLGGLPLDLDTFAGGQYIGPHGHALHVVDAGLGLSWRFGPSLYKATEEEPGIRSMADEKLAVVGGGWKGSIQFRGNGDTTSIKSWTLELRDSQDNLLKTLHGKGPLPDAVDLRGVQPQAQPYHYKMIVSTNAGLMYDRSGAVGTALPENPSTASADGGGPAAQVMVKDGDSLWMISSERQVYGDPMLYYLIIDANKPKLKDPDLLRPGQTLKIEHDVTKQAKIRALKRAWARKEQEEANAAATASGAAR